MPCWTCKCPIIRLYRNSVSKNNWPSKLYSLWGGRVGRKMRNRRKVHMHKHMPLLAHQIRTESYFSWDRNTLLFFLPWDFLKHIFWTSSYRTLISRTLHNIHMYVCTAPILHHTATESGQVIVFSPSSTELCFWHFKRCMPFASTLFPFNRPVASQKVPILEVLGPSSCPEWPKDYFGWVCRIAQHSCSPLGFLYLGNPQLLLVSCRWCF